jgi:hypothetical protein
VVRLSSFDLQINFDLFLLDKGEMPCPFNGNNVKDRIAIYQLKKSLLDFRLVIRCEQTGQFFDTDISCRSKALLEGKIILKSFDWFLKFFL